MSPSAHDASVRSAAAAPTARPEPAPRDELIAVLNELLEAERAGARVARETALELPSAPLAELVQEIHQDEVHWCAMLMRAVQTMQGEPSHLTGAFWGKAMAIADVEQRLLFLNRGQAWVVRRLQALIPRVGDAQVQADLSAMLQAHIRNIERVTERTAPVPAPGLRPADGCAAPPPPQVD